METRIRGVLSGRVAPFGPMGEPSGYAKAIRTDRVEVTLLRREGEEKADLVHHGGVDKAVHHYAIDHYPAWIAERPGLTAAFSEPGAFGENISTLGWRE